MRIFIAQTIDGFIAGDGDALDHLDAFMGVETGYEAMVRAAGAVVLGRRTFDRTFPTYGWTYPAGIPGVVVTRRALPAGVPDGVVAMSDITAIAARHPDAFIDGGADTIRQFLEAGHIREADIFTLPIRIGSGVKLFAATSSRRETWELVDCEAIGKGMVRTRYRIP